MRLSFKTKFTGLWLSFLLTVSCGILVGNPEDDGDSAGNNPSAKSNDPRDPITAETSNEPDETIPSSGATNNEFVFHLTDAPIDDLSAVFVNVAGLKVKPSQGEWIDIPLVETAEINLLSYQNGNALALAKIDSLPAGEYKEIRLILDQETPARALDLKDQDVILDVPSGDTSGIKIKGSFTIAEDQQGGDFTIDFDLRHSLKKSGKDSYKLKPVVKIVSNTDAGSIEGESTADLVCAYPNDMEIPESEEDCESSQNSAKIKGGKFKLAFLPEATYNLRFFDDEGELIKTLEVAVKAGQATEITDKVETDQENDED